jgi:hypothetical protein
MDGLQPLSEVDDVAMMRWSHNWHAAVRESVDQSAGGWLCPIGGLRSHGTQEDWFAVEGDVINGPGREQEQWFDF